MGPAVTWTAGPPLAPDSNSSLQGFLLPVLTVRPDKVGQDRAVPSCYPSQQRDGPLGRRRPASPELVDECRLVDMPVLSVSSALRTKPCPVIRGVSARRGGIVDFPLAGHQSACSPCT
jgi:hypothetical protein